MAEEENKETDKSNDVDLHVMIDETSPYNEAVRYPFACTIDPGSVLIFGGYDNKNMKDGKSISKVWFYNVSINQYIKMKELPFAISSAAATKTPDNRIVIVGSGNKMIIYTPYTEKDDHEIEELPYDIGAAPSIIFDDNHNLHILGGGAGNKQQHLMIKWAKDKKQRKIIDLGNTPNPCYYSGVCHYQNKLYVMGCYEDKQDTLWIYDIDNQTWKNGPNIPLQRSGFGCHLINNNQDIILIGSRYGNQHSDIILLYNIKTNKWRKPETKLKHTIGFHASALLADRREIHGFSGMNNDRNVDTHFVVRYDPK